MINLVLSNLIASVSDLKKHPMQVVGQANGRPIAILNRNKPVFYCISPTLFESLIEKIEDEELAQIINARSKETEITVNIDDL